MGDYLLYLEAERPERLREVRGTPKFARIFPDKDCAAGLVIWYDAAGYCNWLSRREGSRRPVVLPRRRGEPGMELPPDHLERTGYRLPTEAEWEYACRAGSVTRPPTSARPTAMLGDYAWYAGNTGEFMRRVGGEAERLRAVRHARQRVRVVPGHAEWAIAAPRRAGDRGPPGGTVDHRGDDRAAARRGGEQRRGGDPVGSGHRAETVHAHRRVRLPRGPHLPAPTVRASWGPPGIFPGGLPPVDRSDTLKQLAFMFWRGGPTFDASRRPRPPTSGGNPGEGRRRPGRSPPPTGCRPAARSTRGWASSGSSRRARRSAGPSRCWVRVGVTRLAEVGRLDRPGLPNYVAVHPERAAEGISYYNGKGVTRRQARAGRDGSYRAVQRGALRGARRSASHAALSREARAVDPRALLIPMQCDYHPELEMEWALGFDLVPTRPAYVPIEGVLLAPSPRLMMSSSNGLASGNTVEEALCHALCEVIERDALALRDAAMGLRRALGGLISGLGMAYDPSPPRAIRRIDHDGLPPRASSTSEAPRRRARRVPCHITSDIGVATIACSLAECRIDGWAVHEGFGCHPDARVALTRAPTEAYQGRIAHIQGGREDLPEVVNGPRARRRSGRGPRHRALRPVLARPLGRARQRRRGRRLPAGALESAGLAEVIAFDLTDPAIGSRWSAWSSRGWNAGRCSRAYGEAACWGLRARAWSIREGGGRVIAHAGRPAGEPMTGGPRR